MGTHTKRLRPQNSPFLLMNDFLFIALSVAFFALAAAYVAFCRQVR